MKIKNILWIIPVISAFAAVTFMAGCQAMTGACTTNADCDDDIDCTTDACEAETGLCISVNDDANFCSDDRICTTNDTCVDGDCVGSLDPGDCESVADCAEGDTCVGFDSNAVSCGLCEPRCTDDLACDDDDVCTTDSCDTATGVCTHANVECDDGFTCNPTTAQCEDTACTDEAECDDGQFCNGTEFCDPGDLDADADGCVNPGNPCSGTTPICNEFSDTCRACEVDEDCDDGLSCTDDFCELAGACANVFDDGRCDDGLFCTGTEKCDPDEADAFADGCVATGDPCGGETPICNEATDECVGSATSVAFDLSAMSVGFDHVPGETECPQPFGSILVTNTGTVVTMYTISVASASKGSALITTDPSSFTLAPGESQVVGVTFTCAQAVSFTDMITITGEAGGETATAVVEVDGRL